MTSGRSEAKIYLRFVFLGLSRFGGEFFTEFVSVGRVFMGLFGKLVSAKVVALVVSDGGGAVGVGCKVVKFCDAIV